MPLRIGIAGYGGMGEWHHRNTSAIKDLKILAACDIDANRVKLAVENARELYNETEFKGYESLDDMLTDDRLNLILVSTPNDLHKDMCITALNAGKNVLCEKPATMNVGELDAIIRVAEVKKLLFTVHQNRRWDKEYLMVKKSISEGTLGKVFDIDSKLHGGGGTIHGWRAKKEQGGGMILDWGVHMIDQILDMVPDRISTVYCQTLSVVNPGVDDFFKLLISFEGGSVAQIEVGTFCLRGQFRTWHVCGNGGGLTIQVGFTGINGGITKVKGFSDKWESKIVETYAGPTRTFAPLPEDRLLELPLPEVDAQWSEFYDNLRDVVEGKSELIVKPSQVRRVIQVMDACFESAEKGIAVRLEC